MFKSLATINAGGETRLTRAWGLWERWQPKRAHGLCRSGLWGWEDGGALDLALFLGAIDTDKTGLCS